MCKTIFAFEFIKAVIDNFFFKKLPQISYIHKNHILKYNWNFLDQLLLPYKSYGSGMSRIHFFIFVSCEPLKSCDCNRRSQNIKGVNISK